jgi:hypothetical protein
MADMDVAVGIGRAVMQHVARAALRLLAQFLVEVHLSQLWHDLRLLLRQAGAHGKIGLGQEQRLGIVGHSSWLLGARVKANNSGTAR